jgi:hypothetical protein
LPVSHRQDAFDRLAALLRRAVAPLPMRRPTAAAIERRLEEKSRRVAIKRQRRRESDGDAGKRSS